MVLTNIEFWAADGSMPTSFDTTAHHHTRHMNPFDTRAVPHVPRTHHLSSNGYYGFSYINAAHDLGELNNNNNNIDISNNNNNLNHNNNNGENTNTTTTHNFMANDVNGMNTPAVATATVFGPGGPSAAASRCKKRFFVVSDCAAEGNAKRCRFDDDFSAQYCNDFFSLPSTQIGTQSCLMDTEEGIPNNLLHHQQQLQKQQQFHQQQVDEAMFENNNNNNISNNNNNNNDVEKYEHSILHHHLQQQQTEMQTQQPPTPQQQQEQQQQQHPYHHHQQQHYQDMFITTTTTTTTPPLLKTRKTHEYATVRYLQNSVKPQSDIDVDADFKIDDAALYAEIHGGCLYHFIKTKKSPIKSINDLPLKTSHDHQILFME